MLNISLVFCLLQKGIVMKMGWKAKITPIALSFGLVACDVKVNDDYAYCTPNAKGEPHVIKAEDGSVLRRAGTFHFTHDRQSGDLLTCDVPQRDGTYIKYSFKP